MNTTTPIPIIEHCPNPHKWFDITLGSIIMFFTLVSYLPQYYKIIKNKSVDGISHLMIVLSNISAFTNFQGTILLDAYYYKCCQQNDLTKSQCTNTFLPVIQMSVPWICSFIYYIIYVVISDDQPNFYPKDKKIIRYSFIGYLILFPIIIGTLGTIILIATGLLGHHPYLFGNIMNGLSAIVCVFIWLPQIVKTYKDKDIGNLSLITLAIQAPGAILVFVYQDFMNSNSWSVGVPFLLSGIQLCILFAMGYHYTYGSECCKSYKGYMNIDLEESYSYDSDSQKNINESV